MRQIVKKRGRYKKVPKVPFEDVNPEYTYYTNMRGSVLSNTISRIFTPTKTRTDKTIQIAEVGKDFEWEKWEKEIPYLRFPPDCEVKIIPPFLTGIIRFVVRKGKNEVSVYFDAYSMAGNSREPYWEIHPDIDNTNARFNLGDETTMVEEIIRSLDRTDIPRKKRASKKPAPNNQQHDRMMNIEV